MLGVQLTELHMDLTISGFCKGGGTDAIQYAHIHKYTNLPADKQDNVDVGPCTSFHTGNNAFSQYSPNISPG